MFEKTMGGPDLLTDGMIEEVLERQPRKFTIHCVFFLMAIIALFFVCKWISIRILMRKDKDSQLDIMMKRQILESSTFKNCLQHYESNICV